MILIEDDNDRGWVWSRMILIEDEYDRGYV